MRKVMGLVTALLVMGTVSTLAEDFKVEKFKTIPLDCGVYSLFEYGDKLWVNSGSGEYYQVNGTYVYKTKVCVVDPKTGETKELWANGTTGGNMAGNPVFGVVDGYVLMGNTLFDPKSLTVAGKIVNCENDVCPWVKVGFGNYNILWEGFVNSEDEERIFFVDDENTLRIFSIEKTGEGYKYEEKANSDLTECSGQAEIKDVKGSLVAIACDGITRVYKYEEYGVSGRSLDFVRDENGNDFKGTIYFDDEAKGFVLEKDGKYVVYEVYYDGQNYWAKKIAEYDAPNCSRKPKISFEDEAGVCVTDEGGFLIFDLKTGKELYKYTENGNDIWEVLPFGNDTEAYIAMGGWINSINGNGIQLFKLILSETEGQQNAPSETENATVIHFNAGWNLKGTSEGVELSELKVPGLKFVWTYRNGEWFFWSPNSDLVDYARDLIGLEIIDSIKPYEGFWVKVDNDVDVVIEE